MLQNSSQNIYSCCIVDLEAELLQKPCEVVGTQRRVLVFDSCKYHIGFTSYKHLGFVIFVIIIDDCIPIYI